MLNKAFEVALVAMLCLCFIFVFLGLAATAYTAGNIAGAACVLMVAATFVIGGFFCLIA